MKNQITSDLLNKLLRRVDWRFLVGAPSFKNIKCFSNGSIHESLELISDFSIDNSTNSDTGKYELAVAIDPDQSTITQAYDSLSEDGILYAEFSLNRLSSYQKYSSNLKSSGFNHIDFYLPIPPPSESATQLWIPLSSKQAINFTLTLLQQNSLLSKSRKISAQVKKLTWKFFPSLIMKHPILMFPSRSNITVIAIAKKTSRNNMNSHTEIVDGTSLNNIISNTIRHILKQLQLNYQEKELSKLMITVGRFLGSKVILAIFSYDRQDPLLMLKIPRAQQSILPLKNELEIINELNRYIPLEGSIPKMLYSPRNEINFFTAQTYLSGTIIPLARTPKKDKQIVSSVTSLLVSLADCTKHEPEGDWKKQLIHSRINSTRKMLESVVNSKFLDLSLYYLDRIEVSHLVCEHRDLNPRNMLITKNNEVRIFDWETAERHGLPLADLIYFITFYCFYATHAWESKQFTKIYKDMVDGSSVIHKIYTESINQYTSELLIDKSMVQHMRLYTWVNSAISDIESIIKGENNKIKPKKINKNLYVNLWEIELSLLYGKDIRLLTQL